MISLFSDGLSPAVLNYILKLNNVDLEGSMEGRNI